MAAPRVTIIMPAYNAEAFVEHTVRSVLAQSFGDFALLAVDDGSTDGTGAILDRLAAEDRRVRAIHCENGGPALARNRALELVEPGTEYLMFCDADDELLPDALETALREAGDAELVLMGFVIRGADGDERPYAEPEQRLTSESLGAALGRLYKANLLNQVWGKLFRASLVLENGLRFADYRWGEDRLFVYDCLERAGSVLVLPQPLYVYIMHPGESLITRWSAGKFDAVLLADRRMQALCARFGAADEADFRYMFLKAVFSCLTTLYAPSCTLTRAGKRREIRRVISQPQVLARSKGASGGLAVRALAAVLRSGSVTLNALAFRFVAFVGDKAPKLFTRIKHRK